MAVQKKLSLCIIAKNEDLAVGDCLESMKGTVDEMIVADIGLNSGTPELNKCAGAKVYRLAFEDNFSKIKNFCMAHASGDWVLFLQANETIPREQHSELRKIMLNPAAEGYLMQMDDEQRGEACPAQSLRLLRNRIAYRFRYRSYAYIPDEDLYSILSSNVNIVGSKEKTSGWQADERIRLLQMDLKEHPHDGYVRYLQGVKLFNQGKFKESAASLELARHALCGGSLYAPHLYQCLGTCLLMLARYNAAEELLREGIWLFPFYTDIKILRAALYHQLGRDTDALKDLDDCLILRKALNACVPVPKTDVPEIIKMREEIRAACEGMPVKV